jgi:long-chain acyl-CoA synthetase
MIDDDGYLYIRGRSKNMILGSNGKNIYPEEIEAALNEFDLVLESVVYDQNGKLAAKVHLDYEALRRLFHAQGLSDLDITSRVKTVLEDIRREVNARLASFSRLHRIIEQSEPFEKTPTQKIKRHLYVS